MRLSVLDQSMARGEDRATEALQESLQMAQWCEELGYHRFWVSEHHAFPSVAGSAPEVLLAALGAATRRIRLGSGGIMLPHYSPYKVAEVFSLLANLYPERIDLGVGRAPGADMATAMALAPDGRPRFEQFPQQVEALSRFLWDRSAKPLVSPQPPAGLPLWMLGSSPDSVRLAASRGLPYNLAGFINPQVDPSWIRYYREAFQANEHPMGQRPYAILTVSVFCAESEDYARQLQRHFDINFFRFATGQVSGAFLSPEDAAVFPSSPQLEAFIASRSQCRAVGTPAQVRDSLEQLAQAFQVDEIMVVSNMYHLADRRRSFELLMQAMAD